MSKWIKKWSVPGSSGTVWVVSVDEKGEYACSCPVWKFKRRECKHIDLVKARACGNRDSYRQAMPGNVGEVMIDGDRVLYPLVPFNKGGDLRTTIVYDMVRANVSPDQVREYKEQMLGKVSIQQIIEHVRARGRFVYSRFVKGPGWTDPVYTDANLPLRTLSNKQGGPNGRSERETVHRRRTGAR